MVSLEELCQEKSGLSEILFVKTVEKCPENNDFSGGNSDGIGISDEVTADEHYQMVNRSEPYLEALAYLEDKLVEQFDLDIFSEETAGSEQTLVNLGYVIKRFKQASGIIQSEINSLQNEINHLQTRKDLFEEQAELAAKRLLKAMQIHGKKQIETPLVSIAISSGLIIVE
jgi:hypothetical protein